MKNKYIFTAILLLGILVASLGLTTLYVNTAGANEGKEEFTVVTSFYPMYVLTANIIGDESGVSLKNLSEPQTGCLHDFTLTPQDMRLLAEADVFVVNGGGIESFLEDVAGAYPELAVINASVNLSLLEEDGERNAHAWMSISDYENQLQTVTEALCAVDAGRAENYRANAKEYRGKLEELGREQEELCAFLKGRPVVLLHEAYGYVAKDYGLEICGVLNLDEERQVSAGEVGEVLDTLRENPDAFVLAEERYGTDLGNTLERESGVTVIYLDVLNRGDYAKDSYLAGMRHNLELLRGLDL